MLSKQPLVSILTPVYNGDKYLSDCIESVLAQDYRNWEYVIVNNCSTDRTLDIALHYAENDSRIRVVSNSEFVGCEENHNIAFSLIGNDSKYCKVVSADDEIYPHCLREMVLLAERHSNVGIVGSYQLSNGRVKWTGLPRDKEIFSGVEICRRSLLFGLDVFGNPTSAMYRSDLIRKHKPFFYHSMPHADTSACFMYLQNHSFGFVHKILSTERIHPIQESSRVSKLGMSFPARIEIISEFGPVYLTQKEINNLLNHELKEYYKWLGLQVLKMKSRGFWNFQRSRMRALGYPIKWLKVIMGTFIVVFENFKTTDSALKKFIQALNNAKSIR